MKYADSSQSDSGVGAQFRQAATQPAARKKSNNPPPFSIRFSEEERARLDRAAGALSLAAYIRLKLFSEDDAPPPRRRLTRKRYQPSAELAVLGHMLGSLGKSRMASNLNQIAKAANTGALPVTPELEKELLEACAAVLSMRQELISALGVKVQ